MKGKALRKHSLHEKTAASFLLKLFICSNEGCHIVWLVYVCSSFFPTDQYFAGGSFKTRAFKPILQNT